jgi:methionyl-tRNA formyltransferase
MRVVFMGKSKRSAVRALDWLVERGVELPAVVAPEPEPDLHDSQRLDLAARRHGLPLVTEAELYDAPPDGVDLVVSFLFWNLIREPLLSLGSIGCLNFHPAPLPDYRGVGGYNVAILDGLERWGVSCHFVDEHLDTGDVVGVRRFDIDRDAETAFSLDVKSQDHMIELFRDVVGRALDGAELPREPQGEGRYVSRAEFDELRTVRPGDDLSRKLRAFWYPPWPGAVIEVDGRRLTLVDEGLLGGVAAAYRDAGLLP